MGVSKNGENKRSVGAHYERLAAEYLEKNGVEILGRNFRCSQGEIDLIARDGAYLVFAEVKYRSRLGFGAPAEAVNLQKQRRIRNAARYYLYKNQKKEEIPCRFDVISMLGDEICWIKNAF